MNQENIKIFYCHGVGRLVQCQAPMSCNQQCRKYKAKVVQVRKQGTATILTINN